MPFPLLSLPRELRDMIYADAFNAPTKGYITPYTSSSDLLPVALLRTSRQVNAEAKGVLERWRRGVLEGRKREWGFVVNELRLEAFGGGDGDEEYDDRVEMGERFGRGWGVL